MAVAVKARGEVAFASPARPEKNEKEGARWELPGVILRFRNSDLKAIEEKYGVGWFNQFTDACLAGTVSLEELEFYVAVGAKKGGSPYEVSQEELDNIPVDELFELILDGICYAKRGLSAKDYLEEIFEKFQEAKENGEDPSPPSPDTASSTISGEEVSGRTSG